MSKAQEKKRNQLKQARLEIVAGMYKRGYSLRKIQSEVVKRLELSSYSLATVHKDVQTLLDEWRENRIEDMDAPEKKDINGNVSFASLLIESGLLDEPETQDEAE